MNELDIRFKRVPRSKHLRLSIAADGRVLVTRPFWVSEKRARAFVLEKKDWLIKQMEKLAQKGPSLLIQGSREDYLKNKEKARSLVTARIEHFNKLYNFKFKRISIRDQRSRWGSCSRQGGLNFNYRLIYLEPELIDYLVVHELCHLKEMNHGANFWQLVEKAIPNYKDLRYKLRRL
jgi:predicted metal-dependent hydrolase